MATAKQKFVATLAPGADRRKKVTEEEAKSKQPKMNQNNNPPTGWGYWPETKKAVPVKEKESNTYSRLKKMNKK